MLTCIVTDKQRQAFFIEVEQINLFLEDIRLNIAKEIVALPSSSFVTYVLVIYKPSYIKDRENSKSCEHE